MLLDTLGKPEELRAEVDKVDTGLCILETWQVGLESIKNVIAEAMERNRQRQVNKNPKTQHRH